MDIKIFLRDKSKEVVEAWQKIFSNDKNVNISCGDILDIEADAIISPANSFGFMDGGIDRVYLDYFGYQLQDRLQKKIRNEFYGELPVGMATIIDTNYNYNNIKYLVSCPTMRVPEIVANTANAYLAFRAGLISILEFNINNNNSIESVLCPGMGTLTGCMSPETCARQMKFAYEQIVIKKTKSHDDLWLTAMNHHSFIK